MGVLCKKVKSPHYGGSIEPVLLIVAQRLAFRYAESMTVTLDMPKEIEAQFIAAAKARGVSLSDYLRDFIVEHFEAERQIRETLDSRYDDLKSGKVKPIDGEEAFEKLRQREDELLKDKSLGLSKRPW
jgi:hypothetical protein